MADLPSSWRWRSFDEVFDNVTSSERKLAREKYQPQGLFPVIDQGQSPIGGYSSNSSLAYEGPLPVLIFGDHTRCVKLVERSFVQGADGVKVLRPTGLVDSRFAFHALRALQLPNKGYSRHFKFLKASVFPVPELDVQRRIVKKLDELLAQSRAAREQLEAVPALVETYRQSVLAAELTEGDIEPLSSLAEILDPNPSHRYPSYDGGTVPILSTEQFRGRDGWDPKNAKLVKEAFYSEREAANGFSSSDVIFARKGRLGLARPAPAIDRYVFSHTVFIVRPKENIGSKYLLWALRHPGVVTWLEMEMNSNTGVPTLGKGVMARLPIRVPRLAVQARVAARLDSLFEGTDRLVASVSPLLVELESLERSLLAKAFRGELDLDGTEAEVVRLNEAAKEAVEQVTGERRSTA